MTMKNLLLLTLIVFLSSTVAVDLAMADKDEPPEPPPIFQTRVVNDETEPVPVTGIVTIGNFPVPVTGAVSVDNLPLDETSDSLRTISAKDYLRDGYGTIALSAFERQLAIPEGVVLTDAMLRRWSISDNDLCQIYLYRIQDAVFSSMFDLYPSAENPLVELHFESGLRSTELREIGFFMNSDCIVDILWTGYEY
jgi:hypothetical protein